MTDDPAYRSHKVFGALDVYAEFYKRLSMSVMGFLTFGTGAWINLDSYLFQSIGGTLNSVRAIVEDGRINDGYALLRKYFDSVTLSVYIHLYLREMRAQAPGASVKQVKDWLRGARSLPAYKDMKVYVATSRRLEPVIGMLLNADGCYKAIRDRCNGHMHYREFESVLLNDRDVYVDRLPVLDQFEEDLAGLLTLHLACVFYLNDHYMMSSDYVDYRNCGMEPEPGSEFWVAPFVQSVFDDVLKVRRPDVCDAIKSRTSMHLQ